MKAKDFDKIIDDGEEDIIDYLDLTKITRPNQEVQRVVLDLPQWMIKSIDIEVKKANMSSQAIIKMWLAERLESNTSR